MPKNPVAEPPPKEKPEINRAVPWGAGGLAGEEGYFAGCGK
jgi:hypothetical protein